MAAHVYCAVQQLPDGVVGKVDEGDGCSGKIKCWYIQFNEETCVPHEKNGQRQEAGKEGKGCQSGD